MAECNATLNVFDQDNECVKTVNVSTFDTHNRRCVDIAAPGTGSITVVAWSGLCNSEEVTVLDNANIIADQFPVLASSLVGVALYRNGELDYSAKKSGKCGNACYKCR